MGNDTDELNGVFGPLLWLCVVYTHSLKAVNDVLLSTLELFEKLFDRIC